MKKSLVFVIESLAIGGAEKSLVTLLNLLDYSKYEVDLLVFSKNGEFQHLVPESVNVLCIPPFFEYCSIPWKNYNEKLRNLHSLKAQLRYSIELRLKKHNHIEKAVILWKAAKNCFGFLDKKYDVAIAYAQGLPTFYVADKIDAKKKIAWINATYVPVGKYLKYVKEYYQKFEYVNGVSPTIEEQIRKTFLLPREKVVNIADILDVEFAHKMSKMPSDISETMRGNKTKILTVGRFAAMKRYDLAVSAAKILKDRGVDFTWYSIGDGALRGEIQKQIEELHVQDCFVLLGSKSNPYPYYEACNLYVQTSEFEGFGISLAEAKMFKKPIVTTRFNSVGAQFINEYNGLIVDITAEAIANGIQRMMNEHLLKERCVQNLNQEDVENKSELLKFYSVINSEVINMEM